MVFFQKMVKVTPWGAFWAVVIGGGTAIMAKINGGTALKAIITPYGQDFLQTVLGPHYSSLLPIILSLISLLGISLVTKEKFSGLLPESHTTA